MAVFGGYGAKQGASGGDIFARMKGGGIAGGVELCEFARCPRGIPDLGGASGLSHPGTSL